MSYPDLLVEPLHEDHLEPLVQALLNPEVYAHIGERPASHEVYKAQLRRMIAGPQRAEDADQLWLNFALRRPGGVVMGHLQATVHHGLAEVAFLLRPDCWGQGLGSAALHWLHGHLASLRPTQGALPCWATTIPPNLRCQALLERHGYRLRELPRTVPLYSWDPGDLVYHRPDTA
ncbi:GNAT family N-acetyltransferase [Ideonella livida]|nr:GNAT family N-acetyltransferase [Ideonella livida]